MKEQETKIIIFKTEDEMISVDARFDEETVWLSLDQMATLFERDKSTVSRHIRNVYDEGELEQSTTVVKIATIQTEGGLRSAASASNAGYTAQATGELSTLM